MHMRRQLYLFTLLVLQLALVVELASPLALALRVETAPGLAPAGWPAMLQLVATAVAVAGISLAIVFPGLALSRHRRAGVPRFLGMPRWAVSLALIGAGLLAAGAIVLASASIVQGELPMTLALIARPLLAGGLALAAAGVLCAELLRRGLTSVRGTVPAARPRLGRIEVTHPTDLRTRDGNG